VKNDYSIIGMLSRGIIPLPLLGGVGCSLRKEPHPVFASLRRFSPQGKERLSPE
jgi:hypothetical protein